MSFNSFSRGRIEVCLVSWCPMRPVLIAFCWYNGTPSSVFAAFADNRLGVLFGGLHLNSVSDVSYAALVSFSSARVTLLFSITSIIYFSPLFIRRDKNGTKPENKISKNTFEPIKSLRHIALRLQSFCKRAHWKLVFKLPSAAKTYAKVLFCPVKNEGKSIIL